MNYVCNFEQVEQITAEYKILALQHHPDKNDGEKEAEMKFQKLKACINSNNVNVQIISFGCL